MHCEGIPAETYYCQQVSLQFGGWQFGGCAGLNLHLTKSHLIFINISDTPHHTKNRPYFFVFLLRCQFFSTCQRCPVLRRKTNQILSVAASSTLSVRLQMMNFAGPTFCTHCELCHGPQKLSISIDMTQCQPFCLLTFSNGTSFQTRSGASWLP